MTSADIAAGMRLKEIAGWNQTVEDWARFIRFNPQGCFVAECDGRVAGTVATIIYEGHFAWIGMVLVDPDFRGLGIGTALLDRAVEGLDSKRIPCIKLDATPQGKPLYERLGFKVEYEIERWLLTRQVSATSPSLLSRKDVSAVLAIDREVFGADRAELLRSVAAAAPDLFSIALQDGHVAGYALVRRGSRADHLGPWIARDAEAARELFGSFLERSRRELIFVDVLTDNRWAPALVKERGFELSRPLTRMYRGVNTHPGRPDLVCAILGPEFG